MNSSDIDWNDVIKKEARGINDEDLGEVQEIQGIVLTLEICSLLFKTKNRLFHHIFG